MMVAATLHTPGRGVLWPYRNHACCSAAHRRCVWACCLRGDPLRLQALPPTHLLQQPLEALGHARARHRAARLALAGRRCRGLALPGLAANINLVCRWGPRCRSETDRQRAVGVGLRATQVPCCCPHDMQPPCWCRSSCCYRRRCCPCRCCCRRHRCRRCCNSCRCCCH